MLICVHYIFLGLFICGNSAVWKQVKGTTWSYVFRTKKIVPRGYSGDMGW